MYMCLLRVQTWTTGPIHCRMRLSSDELVVSNYRLMKDPNNEDVVSRRCKPIETYLSFTFNEVCLALTRHASLLTDSFDVYGNVGKA